MKQSSIEWLIEELNKSTSLTSFVPECSDDYKKEILGIIDQAKEMHKQEIIEAYEIGVGSEEYGYGVEYYKNTYEKE